MDTEALDTKQGWVLVWLLGPRLMQTSAMATLLTQAGHLVCSPMKRQQLLNTQDVRRGLQVAFWLSGFLGAFVSGRTSSAFVFNCVSASAAEWGAGNTAAAEDA